MRCSDLTNVFPKFGLTPFQVCECASEKCDKNFALIDGFAFPGQSPKDQQVRLYFFHSSGCYLEALPVEAMWSA